MFDHHAEVQGPWAGGWMVAAIAGLFAAVCARAIGEVGISPSVLVGAVTFLVFGVLLGSGGVELTAAAHDRHDGHGHHDHGHH